MNFQLKCRNHTECPDDLKNIIETKVSRFAVIVPETAYLELQLMHYPKVLKGGDKEAEIILDLPGVKPVIRFVAEGETFLEAVDRVLDKLDEELSKQKQREHDYSYSGDPLKVKVAEELNKEEL